MNFKEVLANGCFCVALKADTKRGVLEEMVDLLVACGKVKDRDAVLSAVIERERRMSTGIQHGVAIPHGKTDAVDSLTTVFALKKEGIDFSALDAKPSYIFVMTISPLSQTGPHMQYLTDISRLLTNSSIRERLLAAGTVDEIIAILTGA